MRQPPSSLMPLQERSRWSSSCAEDSARNNDRTPASRKLHPDATSADTSEPAAATPSRESGASGRPDKIMHRPP
eukprot:6177223-Pleurochrysis_carterae.AAC.1